ncbi:uncharacterized protein LOC124111260 [Haliotis rufescens]|uniref:uncharacterized protein LOC124111260 n=1 Tax=Haliotis rufescens TaxID=6454 RepID=UPI00201E7F0E|nr:uncharacterized protein LOC124111260 [Haliotis rufescens]
MMGALRVLLLLLLRQELLVESKEIRTNESGNWDYITKLSNKGINVAGMTTLTFSHKGCGKATVELYQQGFAEDSLALKFSLMIKDKKSGHRFGNMRKCILTKTKNMNCSDKIRATMTSSCDDFKPFWISMAESGIFMVGEGCKPGNNTLWKLSDIGSFNLGEIGLGSDDTTEWKFGEECSEAVSASTSPTTTVPVSHLPVQVNLQTVKEKGFLRLSQNGIAVTRLSTLFFEVTSCDKGQLILLPGGEKIGDRAHKFVVQQTTTEGNVIARHLKCTILGYEDFDCYGSVSYAMEPICNEYKTFWIRLKSSEVVEYGEGCNPENGTMFTYTGESPFSLGDIAVKSRGSAKWKFGSSVCNRSLTTSTIDDDEEDDWKDRDDPDINGSGIEGGSDNTEKAASVSSGSAGEVGPDNVGTDVFGGSDGNETDEEDESRINGDREHAEGVEPNNIGTNVAVDSVNIEQSTAAEVGSNNSGTTQESAPNTIKADKVGGSVNAETTEERGSGSVVTNNGDPDTIVSLRSTDSPGSAGNDGLDHSGNAGEGESDTSGSAGVEATDVSVSRSELGNIETALEQINEESGVTTGEIAATEQTSVTVSAQSGELADMADRDEEEDNPNLSSILKSFLDSDGSSAGTSTPSLGMLLAVCLHHLWNRLFGQNAN